MQVPADGQAIVKSAIEKNTVRTKTVSFPSGTEKVSGFLALPASRRPRWAIIAIHEWWGLNDWVKEQTRDLAAHGHIVLAVDLYRGEVAVKRAQARELKRSLPKRRAIGDLKSAFQYLTARADVDPQCMGSIGWSMGGSLAVRLAIHERRLAACVVNYGMPPASPQEIQKINAQVLGNFGQLDRGVPVRKVRIFENTLKAFNKSVDIRIYPHAGHAFANPDDKRRYRPEAAADMGSRIIEFFAHPNGSGNSHLHM